MTLMQRRRALMGAQKAETPIPSNYQEVSFLNVNGAGLIETDKKLPKTAITITGKTEVICEESERYLFADRDVGGVRFALVAFQSNRFGIASGIYVRTDTLTNGTHSIDFTASISQPVQSGTSTTNGTASIYGSVDGQTFDATGSGQIRAFGNNNIIFFNNSSANNGNLRYKGKLVGRMKVYSVNSICYEFVPCYRKADSVVGLYENITGNFYPSVGTVTKGADV